MRARRLSGRRRRDSSLRNKSLDPPCGPVVRAEAMVGAPRSRREPAIRARQTQGEAMRTCRVLLVCSRSALACSALSGVTRLAARLSDQAGPLHRLLRGRRTRTTSPRGCSASICRSISASSSSSRTAPAPAATSARRPLSPSPPDGYTIVLRRPEQLHQRVALRQACRSTSSATACRSPAPCR